MNSVYFRLAQTYTRYVRRLSPRAATVLEEINHLHGEQAAYQVAFMIVASKYNLEHQEDYESYRLVSLHTLKVNLQNPHKIIKAKAAGVKYFQLNRIS